MRKKMTTMLVLAALTTAQAATIKVTVSDTRCQTITGFGAAACDGAMRPYASDTEPVKLLYGDESEIGLNIMRMEISPNHKGNITAADVGWDTPYDWYGSVPCAKEAKKRGAIVFGTPWSPPGDYKTNGTAQGGNSEEQGYQRGTLRTDCYGKFFPWLNNFLQYMKNCGVTVDAVSLQNEPDWWVSYSGCLYTPEQLLTLVKEHAQELNREKFGVKLISAEPLGFDPKYSDILMNDETARDQIDIVAGHIYGHPPLGDLKKAAKLALQYGKEVWMTEHSSDNINDHKGLPTWHEQLLFAEEVNECMLAGCTAYVYWYMRAHWAFVGTGEQEHMPGNTKNKLLPRAYVMSHFSKYLTGSTRLETTSSVVTGTTSAFETSAYIKGDSLIVMAIDTTKYAHQLQLTLPVAVKSGTQLCSDPNGLRQQLPVTIDSPTKEITLELPARSVNTYVFLIDKGSTAIQNVSNTASGPKTYYDLRGHRIMNPKGLCIERSANGKTKKIIM